MKHTSNVPPTSEELTRAWIIAARGDDCMTEEDRAFVRDVIQRDNAEAMRRTLLLFGSSR